MQGTALYQYLLDLQSPWTVSRVNLDLNEQRVDVWAEHSEEAKWLCPHCTDTLPLYDHAEERTWRHLDSCRFPTYLHASIPRITCGKHGVVQVLVPWAALPWPTASATASISRRRSISTAEGATCTHAKLGSALFYIASLTATNGTWALKVAPRFRLVLFIILLFWFTTTRWYW